MQLTTKTEEVKSRVIILMNKSKIPITKRQEELLLEATKTNNPIIRINGHVINLHTITEIKDYVEEPVVQQQSNYRDESYFNSFRVVCETKDPKRAIKEVLSGLRQYIASDKYCGTNAPIDLLSKGEAKIQEIKKT